VTVDELLGRLERVKRSGTGWQARCPAHEDREPSLSVAAGDKGRVLLHCHAGCSLEAVLGALGLAKQDLYPVAEGGAYTPRSRRRVVQLVRVDGEPVGSDGGLTLEALAEAKRLPIDVLAELGCETVFYFGPPAVRIPYFDEHGEIVGIRYRLALEGDARFRWKKGTKASRLLYGASRLRDSRERGFVLLVEGESDFWTLTHHGFPAIALPGAGMWSEEHTARLEGIETVFVVAEDDEGGKTLVECLRTSSIRPRVRIVRLDANDISEVHLRDPGRFAEELAEALEQATSLLDVEQEQRRVEAEAHWRRCEELAGENNILDLLAQELRARGFVGPVKAAKLVFLVLVSRRLKRPVSLVLRGLSSAGKSYTVESVLVFFPSSAYFSRSGMSERALIFSEESFEHRILYIAEADAIAGEGLSAYFLRTLISENQLVYEVTEKEDDRFVTRVITKPGPVGAILTTTKLRLHSENETRMLALTVPDDPGLTRQIMRAIAVRDDEGAEADAPEPWHALQSWLELGGEQRVVDEDGFLLHVAEHIPVVAVRLRRDFALVRSLVFTHALLHQASRGRDGRGRVIATLEGDYGVVRDLIADVVAEGIGATISDDVRETVAAVRAALDLDSVDVVGSAEDPVGVKRVGIQAQLGLDDRATRRRLAQAVEAGFIVNTNPGRGKTAFYQLGDPIPDDIDVLPTVEALQVIVGPSPDNLDNPASKLGDISPSPSPVVLGDPMYPLRLAEAGNLGHITRNEFSARYALHKLIEHAEHA
jgi:hypothetical protein